jgi:hypothetical protein
MYSVRDKPEASWDFDKKIFIKENVVSREICEEIIAYGENNVLKGVNKYPNAFSISFYTCLLPANHYINDLLQSAWEEAIKFLDVDIDFVEPYELKRYNKNDFFGKHVDSYYSLSHGLDRKLTFSLQLSDVNTYDAGEFNVLSKKFKLNQGSIICFPSYFPHDVTRIANGTRWALIGWAWGNNWK